MKLAHGGLGSGHDLELGQAHLEHHVGCEGYLLSDHDERASGRSDVSQVEIGQVAVAGGRCTVCVAALEVLDFTVASADETL